MNTYSYVHMSEMHSRNASYAWGFLTGLHGWHDVLEGIAADPEEFRRGMAAGIKIRMQNKKSLLTARQASRR